MRPERPQLGRNDSFLSYLEPPHLHDPSSVSSVASLPEITLDSLPETVQTALYNLQQATSIVYASFIRYQELLQERFDRLNPSQDDDGEYTFSEPSYMTYTNSLSAERSYLLSGAITDWRHKASLTRVAIQPYASIQLPTSGVLPNTSSSTTIADWWTYLQTSVDSWITYAREIHVPDYEDTIAEFLTLAHQGRAPSLSADEDDTPLETAAMPTPVLEESEPVSIVRDFAVPGLPEFEGDAETVLAKGTGLGLTALITVREHDDDSD